MRRATQHALGAQERQKRVARQQQKRSASITLLMQHARWLRVSRYPCAAGYHIAPRWNQTRAPDTLRWPPDGQTQPTCAL